MASKQLGKLRQWAGEVISSKDKTSVTEEFKELEEDIELRKDGVLRLHMASEAYHHSLQKKKESAALDENDKLLPIDALGLVMLTHGEAYPSDSAYGTALVNFGRAHCRIATLQETFALSFQDTFLSALQHSGEDIKDYEHQRKKLDSRRLSYDAAMSKLEKLKASKKPKEKDVKEAEEELQKARLRYEETSEDVRSRMYMIQESEASQLRSLTEFLDVEMKFVQQYLEVLQETKSNWCDESVLQRADPPRLEGPSHVFSRAPDMARSNSTRSRSSGPKSTRSNSHSTHSDDEGSEIDDKARRPSRSRRPSTTHRKSDSVGTAKGGSRPSSRMSRKRADSNVASGGDGEKKDKSDKDKNGRMMSMAGWASSLTGRGKKDKDKFAALQDEDAALAHSDDDGDESSRSYTSARPQNVTSTQSSPAIPYSVYRPASLQSQERRVMRARHSFEGSRTHSGSTEELSFRAGDEITVVGDAKAHGDGWLMGELNGRRGVFPALYAETASASPPKMPSRPKPLASSDDDLSKRTLVNHEADGYGTSDYEDHPFGDHLLAASRSPLAGHYFDTASIASSAAEEEEETRLVPNKPSSPELATPPISPPHRPITTRRSTPDVGARAKKAPPPPPPRRNISNAPTPTPPIPHRPSATRSKSASSVPQVEDGASPFETTGARCAEFKQNPFKPQGMCSNCFEFHS